MAIKINTPISINGIPVSTGSMVMPIVQFNPVQLGESSPGEWNGTKVRSVYIKLPLYGSKLLFQQMQNPMISVDDFDYDFTHNLTDVEYDNYTPEMRDEIALSFIEQSTGVGTCEIIDPYIIDPV